jgi:glycosyltransferase involved in cell wall biosynthesis
MLSLGATNPRGKETVREREGLAHATAGRCPKLLFLVTEDWYFCSHRLALGRAAVAAGYEVIAATRVTDHGDVIREAGIRVIPLPWRRRSTNVWNELRTFAALLRIYRRERPDLVHHVALKPVLYGSLVARLTGTRRVINAVAGFGYSFVAAGKRAALARRILRSSFKRLSNRRGTRIVVQNPDDERTLSETGTVRADRLVVIPGSGVDVERFTPVGEPRGAVRVALVSRMLWSKGVGEFVESARILAERGVVFTADLVGDPDPENPQSIPEETLRRWQEEGVVVWRGHTDDVPSVWARSHVAVLPSYREGLPKTLLEAAACGRPIVATDVPGCREIVADAGNGILVPVRNESALALAIEKLVTDAELRREMGAAGRAIVVEKYSEDVVIERVLSLYRSMMENE